uniref:CUB domain-containing protein n=1 Tax=Neolamprologus brichardi TaxID=32507 RepID=A0A3Q4GUR1_NEOBR
SSGHSYVQIFVKGVLYSFVLSPLCCCLIEGCHSARGEITSPCYPQRYPNSYNCRWIMQAPTGFIIQLSFLDFELEEAPRCIYDWVKVNTGSAEVVFCGLTANGLIQALNNKSLRMGLVTRTAHLVTSKGRCYKICYLNIDVCGIHGNLRISAKSSQNHFNDHQTAETANDERTGKQTLQKDVNTKYSAFTRWYIHGHTISADVSLQPHFCCSIPKKFQLSQILPNNKTHSFISNKTSVKNRKVSVFHFLP